MIKTQANKSATSWLGSDYRDVLLSDVGDVLISTNPSLEIQKTCLHELFCKNEEYRSFTKNDVYALFLPFKRLSQTENTLEESVMKFFQKYNIRSDYEGYFALYSEYSKGQNDLELNPGVSETLEYLNNEGISVVLISDSCEKGEKLSESLKKMIMHDKGITSEMHIDTNNYYKGYYSSKDFGVKKDEPMFLRLLLSKLDFYVKRLAYVGHDMDELISMAKYGIKIYCVDNESNHSFHPEWGRLGCFKDIMDLQNIMGDYFESGKFWQNQ